VRRRPMAQWIPLAGSKFIWAGGGNTFDPTQ
jgi:hypothetical protein